MRKHLSFFVFLILLSPPAFADLRFETGDDFFVRVTQFWVDVYCSSRRENRRWMGAEFCSYYKIEPSYSGYDRLVGTVNPLIDRVKLERGKLKYEFEYDGEKGMTRRFDLADVLDDGELLFTYQLLGKKQNGNRPVIEEGSLPIHAEVNVDHQSHRMYHYWDNMDCSFRRSRDQICY